MIAAVVIGLISGICTQPVLWILSGICALPVIRQIQIVVAARMDDPMPPAWTPLWCLFWLIVVIVNGPLLWPFAFCAAIIFLARGKVTQWTRRGP